jgi:hypothetical protein
MGRRFALAHAWYSKQVLVREPVKSVADFFCMRSERVLRGKLPGDFCDMLALKPGDRQFIL